MSTIRVERHIEASPERVYHALLDPVQVQRWIVPEGMHSHVHSFESVVGGHFDIVLTPDAEAATGLDRFHGHFTSLVPDREVVQVVELGTDDADAARPTTVTFTLVESGEGTDLVVIHEGVDGAPVDDDDLGLHDAIEKLAAILERRRH